MPIRTFVDPYPPSWIDFLLNDSLLDKHLSQVNPDPSPAQLIVDFLRNAESPVGATHENTPKSAHVQLLKLLAIKIFARGNWKLETIERDVPLSLIQSLLFHLCRFTGCENTTPYSDSLTDLNIFALCLYHRFVLRQVQRLDFTAAIESLSGSPLVDTYLCRLFALPLQEMKVLNQFRDRVAPAVEFLEQVVIRPSTEYKVPVIGAFELARSLLSTPLAAMALEAIPAEEFHSDIYYDLGGFYFHRDDRERGQQMINKINLKTSMYASHIRDLIPLFDKMENQEDHCVMEVDEKPKQQTTSLLVKKEQPLEGQKCNLLDGVTDVRFQQARQFLLSFDPSEIQANCSKLRQQRTDGEGISSVIRTRLFPRLIQNGLDTMSNPAGVDFLKITFSKASFCGQIKRPQAAKRLLSSATQLAQESRALINFCRSELLETTNEAAEMPELLPDLDLLFASFALNSPQRWPEEAEVTRNIGPFYELARRILQVCVHLQDPVRTRSHARTLCDLLAFQFSAKTAAQGCALVVTLGVRIRQMVPLSLLISCLLRLLANTADISIEFRTEFDNLWPTVVAGTVDSRSLLEALSQLIDHALRIDQATFLPIAADFALSQRHYSLTLEHAAAHFLLRSRGVIHSVPPDDHLMRHVIKASSPIHCSTLAAVFTQLLSEVDYACAFKALQEKNVEDGGERHYDDIWDVTILEYLIHHLSKQRSIYKRDKALQLIAQPDRNEQNESRIKSMLIEEKKCQIYWKMASMFLT